MARSLNFMPNGLKGIGDTLLVPKLLTSPRTCPWNPKFPKFTSWQGLVALLWLLWGFLCFSPGLFGIRELCLRLLGVRGMIGPCWVWNGDRRVCTYGCLHAGFTGRNAYPVCPIPGRRGPRKNNLCLTACDGWMRYRGMFPLLMVFDYGDYLVKGGVLFNPFGEG